MFTIKKILFPIDLDAKETSPVLAALQVAKTLNSEIHVFYVNDSQAGYRHPTDREDAVSLKVKEITAGELPGNLKIIYAVSKGDLAQEIVKYCKDNSIDLVIVGHKYRHKMYDKIFDSADIKIIDALKLPVLVIPQE
jgi:nucleotide-binding universal stress UspA family protein